MADITVDATARGGINTALGNGAGFGTVWTAAGTGYIFYIDSDDDFKYTKTTDSGATWAAAVTISGAAEIQKFCVWFDKWTPSDTGVIVHTTYYNAPTDTVFYRQLNTSTDVLGTQRTVVTEGASAGAGDWSTAQVGVVKAIGGNIYVAYHINGGGTQHAFYRSTDGGVTFGSRTDVWLDTAADQIHLMPGAETNNQDIYALLLDRSTDDLLFRTYADTGNTWTATGTRNS